MGSTSDHEAGRAATRGSVNAVVRGPSAMPGRKIRVLELWGGF